MEGGYLSLRDHNEPESDRLHRNQMFLSCVYGEAVFELSGVRSPRVSWRNYSDWENVYKSMRVFFYGYADDMEKLQVSMAIPNVRFVIWNMEPIGRVHRRNAGYAVNMPRSVDRRFVKYKSAMRNVVRNYFY